MSGRTCVLFDWLSADHTRGYSIKQTIKLVCLPEDLAVEFYHIHSDGMSKTSAARLHASPLAFLAAYNQDCGVRAREMKCNAWRNTVLTRPCRQVWFYWSKNSQNTPLLALVCSQFTADCRRTSGETVHQTFRLMSVQQRLCHVLQWNRIWVLQLHIFTRTVTVTRNLVSQFVLIPHWFSSFRRSIVRDNLAVHPSHIELRLTIIWRSVETRYVICNCLLIVICNQMLKNSKTSNVPVK